MFLAWLVLTNPKQLEVRHSSDGDSIRFAHIPKPSTPCSQYYGILLRLTYGKGTWFTRWMEFLESTFLLWSLLSRYLHY